jgi:hypothetical protein
MVWFVHPLEKKGAYGNGCGIWHLTASSDEGGGFYVGCDHDHASSDEAQSCLEARKAVGSVTGFPLEMDTIKINGVAHQWPHDDQLSHERICELAGQPPHASVTYQGPRDGDSQRSGITHAGKSIKIDDGMIINCVVTGKA